MSVVLDIGGGQIVEFPDMQTAQAFMASQAGGQPAAQPERGFGAMLYDNIIGNPNDGVNSPGERLGTWLNRAGETMTLGTVGDEAAATVTGMLPGRTYEGELERYRGNEEAMTGAGRLSADLTGGITGAIAAPIGTLARGASMGARIGAGGLSGAGMGAAYGFMEGEGGLDERTQEAGQGAGFGLAAGLAAPVIGGLVQRGADAITGNRAIRQAAAGAPTADELRASARALYRQIDDQGMRIRPEAIAREMDGIGAMLADEGTSYRTASRVLPQSSAIADELAEMGAAARPGSNIGPGNPVSYAELDQLRRYVSSAAANARAATTGPGRVGANDARVADQALSQVSGIVERLSPDDVVAGDVRVIQELLPRAQEIWRNASRTGLIEDAADAADGYLGGTASGVRNQLGSILRNPSLRNQFSPAEQAVMRRAVNGSIPQRALTLMGSGLGNLTQMAMGASFGGLPGALVGMGTAAGTRYGADRMAGRNMELVRALIANGRLPETLPVGSDMNRRIAEQLLMRGSATAAAQ